MKVLRYSLLLVIAIPMMVLGQIGWVQHPIPDTEGGTTHFELVDLDQDGDLDAVYNQYAYWYAGLWWMENINNGDSFAEHTVVSGWQHLRDCAVADFNGDGDLDIAGVGLTTVWVWYQTQGDTIYWDIETITEDLMACSAMDVGDIDGDGDPDLALTRGQYGNTWIRNNGSDPWEIHYLQDGGWQDFRDIIILDVDNDGDNDIVASNNDTVLYENVNGDGSSFPIVTISFNNFGGMIAVDIDGDFDTDIFTAESTLGWIENEGAGDDWSDYNIPGGAPQSNGRSVVDIDNDGDLDIVTAHQNQYGGLYEDKLTYWINDGSFLFDSHFVTEVVQPYYGVVSGDIDGDGDIDLMSRGADGFSWWEQVPYSGPEIHITNPLGGETWYHGFTYEITWDDNITGDVRLEWWTGTLLDLIAESTPSDGSFMWTIPDQGQWLHHSRIKVTSVDNEFIFDFSNELSIQPTPGPVISIISPSGGEVWARGETHTIEWSDNLDENVEINLLINGSFHSTIISSTPSDGTYEWTIPETGDTGSNFEIEIASVNDPAISDVSGVFTISGGEADPVEVILTPTSGTNLPANGGLLEFDANVVSDLPNSYPGVWFWTKVKLPNGTFYPQIQFQYTFTLTPYMDLTGSLMQDIPSFAPAGDYEMWAWIGVNPNGGGPQFGGFFPFAKNAAVIDGTEINEWSARGEFEMGETVASEGFLPTVYEMQPIYPNPFNPTTKLQVTLPATSELTVTVYNVMGQQVAELVRGSVDAGTHTFTLDGSNLASGMYFVRATVPGQLNAVQKVMLVR